MRAERHPQRRPQRQIVRSPSPAAKARGGGQGRRAAVTASLDKIRAGAAFARTAASPPPTPVRSLTRQRPGPDDRQEAQRGQAAGQIVGHATQSQDPRLSFTIAPIGATSNLSKKTGWCKDDVDLFESTKPSPWSPCWPCASTAWITPRSTSRRCMRPGPSGRLHRLADHPDPDPRAEEYWRQARRGLACIGGGELTAVVV